MLQYRLAGSERSGNKTGAPFGDRIQGIHAAYARFQETERPRLLTVSLDGDFYRPLLNHVQFKLLPFLIFDDRNLVIDGILTFGDHLFDPVGALHLEGYHDLVGHVVFVDFPEPVAGNHPVAGFGQGLEIP